MSKYWSMTSEDARRYLERRTANIDDPELAEFQRAIGSGKFVDPGIFGALRKELLALKKRFPAKLRRRDQEGGRFEQQACEIVHRHFEGLDASIFGDMDFWTWLAVAKFADIVEWRFGAERGLAKPENYGIGKRSENLLFRLWLRADIAKEGQGKRAYDLAKSGDQDLWRSHILRQNYANARDIARALLRLQAGKLKQQRLGIDAVRELAKRLRRLHANVAFEFLSAPQSENVVIDLSSDLANNL